ncbi:MAG TPA: glycosyltransferase [Candidatus Angelobacter sp.]|nr:glycosyltransferase [Candidatus Angelobacter sp.]
MARILHVITGLDVGGAENMLYKLVSASSPAHEHSVVSLAPAGSVAARITALGVEVHSLKLHAAAPNPLRVWKIRSLASRLSPDLIAGWMYHGNLMASFAGRAVPGAPVLWGIRSSLDDLSYFSWPTAAVIRLGARWSGRAAGIIYASHAARAQHEARGYHAACGAVIPNGIDCREFVPDPGARAAIRSELGVSGDAILIGMVARCHPAKNQAGFIRAAALLARDHPGARFLLAGPGIAKDSRLRARVRDSGLTGRVLLLGERHDMPRLHAALDIACSASFREGFPNAIAEAMACAVPCVVTSVGDSALVVGETGVAVAPGDPQALAGAIHRLIAAGEPSRQELGARARRRIEDNFSLSAAVEQYENFYARHLASSKTCSPGAGVDKPAIGA